MAKRVAFLAAIIGGFAAIQACGSDEAADIPNAEDGGVESGVDAPPPTQDGAVVGSDASDGAVVTTPSDAGSDADAAPPIGITLDGGACDGGAVGLASVTPKFSYQGQKTSITISGSGFIATPRMFIRDSVGTLTQLSYAAFVSETSVSATIPSGLAPGAYELVVLNPDGCVGSLAGFNVVDNPVPVILAVSPGSGTSQNDTAVVVTGCNFPANATLSTVNSSGVVTLQVASAPVAGSADARCGGTPLYTMDGTIQTKTKAAQLPPGAYVVRVDNPTDTTYGEWASFVVTNPSGNLGGNWLASNALTTGRRSLGLVSGRVDDSNRFLYAVGGEDSTGTALSSIEIAPLDRFGQIGKWFTARRSLGLPRSGLAVVRQGQFLYAIGGTSSANGTAGANATNPSGTPLASIELAKILDPVGAPKLSEPTPSTASGALAAGAYYYKVAAILGSADPATEGETLASDEVVAVLSAQGNVQLSWAAPSVGSVVGYRVYRTKNPDDPSGSEVLLKDNVATTSYTDTGSDVAGTEVPMPLGSTGPWKFAARDLKHARLDTAAVIAPDPSGAGQYLYVLGGYGQCEATTGIMGCYEVASISDDGATLGTFTPVLVGPAQARMRHGFAVMTAANGPANFADDADARAAFVVVSGGKGINSNTSTVEYALVGPGGLLGAFAKPTSGYSGERDGTQLVIANGYGYALQGGSAAGYGSSQTTSQSALSTVMPTTLSFANWSNAAANLGNKLARHGATTESAYIYIAGGTTNDSDALSTVYRILH